ncbi:MAG: glycerol-3-phosphate acyltransferase, partial [candidate division FCPU426 bacterium]
MIPALYLAACYLLGALPTGYLAGRALRGIDIRKEGSGNMGATNVFRVLGKGPGIAVLLIDVAKGAAAVALLPRLIALPAEGWVLAGGLAAVLGHNYTVFLNFKGGKGVATSAGVF